MRDFKDEKSATSLLDIVTGGLIHATSIEGQ